MTTITKERAEIKSFITGFLSDAAHDKQSSNSLLANVFCIALASLEAEPVAWTDEEELRDVKQYGLGEIFQCPPDKYADSRRVIPLYRELPAPVVPDARPSLNNGIVGFDEGWNACRAAMLYSAEPVSQAYKLNALAGNSPVTPDGWISCSERMPPQDDWILIYSKHGEYMAGQVQGEYVELSDGTLSWLGNALFWMPLPEPPRLKEL